MTPGMMNTKKINTPLTCDNKGFVKYKFNFNYETKGNGVIVPKDKENEKKNGKAPNVFRKETRIKIILLKQKKQITIINKIFLIIIYFQEKIVNLINQVIHL
jgi:hypothetical protein